MENLTIVPGLVSNALMAKLLSCKFFFPFLFGYQERKIFDVWD